MAKQYLVTNPSSAICIVGRRRIEIPEQCVKHPCSFSGAEEAKTLISRFKRRYPLLKFEPVGDSTEEAETAVPSSEKTVSAPEPEQGASLMDADTFAKNAIVERTGSGWCAVVVAGLGEPLKVRLSASEPVENAVPRAFAQYAGENKEQA